MTPKLFQPLALVAFFLSLASCATYTMTPQQLYTTLQSGTPRQATSSLSFYGKQHYTTNGLREIVCTDKKGNTKTLINSPQIEMRITDTNGHRHNFFFDTISLEDAVFRGSNSRLLNTYRSIHFANIRKVEVQNGRKAYYSR